MDEELVERVLRAVELIPPGRVAAYGDIAGLVGTGPRLVGRVMATEGSGVAWWRVTNAYGDLPRHLLDEAFQRWAAEGILPKPNGRGCRITAYRCDLVHLAEAYDAAIADLAPPPSDRADGLGASPS